jgi:ring-1,2-phenylacetyl-CoA epoxidase subunit PaaE
MRPKFHALKVKDVRRETKDAVSVAFEVPEELKEVYRFKQGQYLTLRQMIDGEDVRRSYSVCSGIHEGELRVAIKAVAYGKFSNWINSVLKVGDEMQVMTPMGMFTTPLHADNKKEYLLFAGGSGVTPILSIAKSVLVEEPKSTVTMIYANRQFGSIIFREQLEDLKDAYIGRFRLFHVLDDEPNEVELFSGMFDRNKLERFTQTFIELDRVDEAFVCGPEPMIRLVTDFLKEKNLAPEKIHFELFASPGQPAAKPADSPTKQAEQPQNSGKRCAVTVVYDGHENNFYMPMDGTPILDAAQKSGMDIPFSCKGGMCCTCRAHLSEGSAPMRVNYALEPGEVEAGYVLTCQAVPTTERIVVDFDRH